MPASVFRVLLPVLVLLAVHQLGGAALIHAKAWLAPLLIERAWLQSRQAGAAGIKPWPWADTWPVARLRSARHGVDQFVLDGDSGNALAFSPGHARASAPLGSTGRAVIGGHRDTHFAFLQQLALGDSLQLELPGGQVRRYRVEDIAIVDTSWQRLEPAMGSEELLLVTCYPFTAIDTGGPLRYVVAARPATQDPAPQPWLRSPIGGFDL